jgi:hypothetical protein
MLRWLTLLFLVAVCASAQIIRFYSGGLTYQTLTKDGVTVMFAQLPTHVNQYSIVQAAVSNGSGAPRAIRPEDFVFRLPDGRELPASSPETVVDTLLEKASRNDVMQLVATYERGLYGLERFKSTSGYDQRRQAAEAALISTKLRAAAAASAIAFVGVKLSPGESTDGALFFQAPAKTLNAARLRVTVGGQVYEFEAEPAAVR